MGNKFDNPYMDDNGVHYNKLGLTNGLDLRLEEYRLTGQRADEILEQKILGRASSYDFSRLKDIHHHLFQDVYEWAGKPRTVKFAKMVDKNTLSEFGDPEEFEKNWQALAQKTSTFVASKGLTFNQKVDALTDIFVEANRIHPFPDGNGRSLQIFMQELAREQGVVLDYSKTNPMAWNRASAISGTLRMMDEQGRRGDILPSNRDLIGKVFANMARPERILERASGMMNRVGTMFRQAFSSSNDAERRQPAQQTLEHIREVGRSGNVSLIVATEKAIVEGDLTRFTHNQAMTNSLKTALTEIAVIEQYIGIVDDKAKYQAVDQTHGKNRKEGLPYDEARRAFTSHYARLNNMNRSQMNNDEKKIINARKSAIFAADKLYAERQAKTLGIKNSQNRVSL
jgi:cell filamentation protein